ncbi:hypothetical protein [Microbacterium sp. CJ88]|uniref:hypothetical protein n=1 Tax=Microbacterium sp. CJ88 TaxID=3445672 RepID=UPI003F65622E
MGFSSDQVKAVRHAFYLADYDSELRTLAIESDDECIFVVSPDARDSMGDHRSLEIVLSHILGRRVMVTWDVGSPTVAFG